MKAGTQRLKTTPLNGLCHELGARLVEFAGWEMPVQFSSVLDEHRAVRAAAGLFDVSHMGEIEVAGEGAMALIQRLTCNDAARLRPGQAQYSAILNERGAPLDDVLVYRRGEDRFSLVVNAGNAAKCLAWIARHAEGRVEVIDTSARRALLALQGPAAQGILKTLTRLDLAAIRYYHFVEGEVGRSAALVSRTGYTGEDGFEISVQGSAAADLFRAILAAGEGAGILPCGLGARDTLRLEAAMLLYGNDIDETTTVLEAGLTRFVRLEKGEFIGREALVRQQREGLTRSLVGFTLTDPGIARHGHAVRAGGREAGRVTSGTFGPHVKKSIGLAYVPPALAADGTRLLIDIRGREAGAVVVPRPFYRRGR